MEDKWNIRVFYFFTADTYLLMWTLTILNNNELQMFNYCERLKKSRNALKLQNICPIILPDALWVH